MNEQKNISPYLGVPGIQMINARYIRVDMLHLKIAEKDLAEGRPSVTPNQPVSVEYNIDDKSFRLTDGYHRYLEKRGGSVEAALLQSRQGVFPDYAVNVTLVKTLNRAPFGDFTEALTREEERAYLEQIYGIENRLQRASEQGFDIHTTWYHGSIPAYGVESADFDAFDKSCIGRNYSQDQDGFFFINDASIASIYATSNSIGRSVTGGCVYPVYLACRKVFQVGDLIAVKNGWGKPSADGVIAVWDNHHHEIKQTASLFGADSIELIDITRGQRMMVVFEPTQIRSIHSSFLPEHRGRSQLLGHDISFPPPPPKPAKPLPEHLMGVISEIENIIHNEPQWNGPGATKLLLKSVGGADWSKDDKLSFFHALHERTINALPYKERAIHIALLAEEIINTRKTTLLRSQGVFMSKKQQNNNEDGPLKDYTIPSSTPVELYTHPSSPPQHWFRFAYDDINAFSPWLMRDENKVFMAYPVHDQELFGPYDDAAVKSNEGPLIAVPLHMVPIPYTLSDEDKDIFVEKLRDSLSELGVPKAKKIPAYVDLNEDAGMFKTLISKLSGPSTIDLLVFVSDLTIQMGGEIKHGKTLDLTIIKDYTDSIVGDFAPTLNHWLSEVFSEESQKAILDSLGKEVPKTQSGGFQVSMNHVLGAYLSPLSEQLIQSFERDVFIQLLQQLPKREGTPVVEPDVCNAIDNVIDPEHVPVGAVRRR